MKNLILDSEQIIQKIQRLSYEIYENNLSEKNIILLGLKKNGYLLSKQIKKHLDRLFTYKVKLFQLKIEKDLFIVDNSKLNFTKEDISNKVIIIIDDVLNSGKTIAYSVGSILPYLPKKIEVAVLVDRSYKNYPILAKYRGLELNTTINEHVEIDLDKELVGYLY